MRERKSRGKGSGRMLPMLHPDAAGIDIGAEEVFVAVPADRAIESVRSFGTFTRDLYDVADWLQSCRVRTVAMESTSIYWIPLFQILETRAFEVFLVNAQHDAILRGERDPIKLAALCNWRVRSSRETVAKSLEGDYRTEHLFTLKQSLVGFRFYQTMIAEVDRELEVTMRQLPRAPGAPDQMPPRTKKCIYQKANNEPAFDLKAELFRIIGVDLTDVPGISAITAHTILIEVGPDLSRFRNASAFASW